MKIEHAAIYVNDLEKAKYFFQTYQSFLHIYLELNLRYSHNETDSDKNKFVLFLFPYFLLINFLINY